MDEQRSEKYSREQWEREAGEVVQAHKEEFASDFAVAAPAFNKQRELQHPEEDRPFEQYGTRTHVDAETSPSRTIGWTALALAILALFIYPMFLGIGAIVLGIIAYMRGTRGLGSWSVIIGGIAVLSYLVLIPTYFS